MWGLFLAFKATKKSKEVKGRFSLGVASCWDRQHHKESLKKEYILVNWLNPFKKWFRDDFNLEFPATRFERLLAVQWLKFNEKSKSKIFTTIFFDSLALKILKKLLEHLLLRSVVSSKQHQRPWNRFVRRQEEENSYSLYILYQNSQVWPLTHDFSLPFWNNISWPVLSIRLFFCVCCWILTSEAK